jgi:hypothetical protein
VLVSVPNRCTVCAERTIGLEIILDAPDGYSKVTWVKWKLVSLCLEIMLISAQDRCTVCDESTTGIEIALGAPDGTPR